MSKQILILDAGVKRANAQGELNHSLAKLAQSELNARGFRVQITRVGDPYDPVAEADRLYGCDIVIVQTPGFWMSTPWELKRYFDEVLTGQARFCDGDGRHRAHPERKYGSGGKLTDKRYMLCSTWNAPRAAFEDKDGFFEGAGIDGLFMPLRKTFEFIGMQQLPSFMLNDIYKNPQFADDFARYKAHLQQYIG